MSEEEIIKELTTYDLTNHFNVSKHCEAINGLINLYKIEKEKNNKYKIQLTDEQYLKIIKSVEDDVNNQWKSEIKEIQEKIHKLLDTNGITRGYQLIIDEYFKEILED